MPITCHFFRLEVIFKPVWRRNLRGRRCATGWPSYAELLSPVVKLMLKKILASKVVQNDDMTVPVQDDGGEGIKTGRLWVSIGDHDHPSAVYTYTPDRGATGPSAEATCSSTTRYGSGWPTSERLFTGFRMTT